MQNPETVRHRITRNRNEDMPYSLERSTSHARDGREADDEQGNVLGHSRCGLESVHQSHEVSTRDKSVTYSVTHEVSTVQVVERWDRGHGALQSSELITVEKGKTWQP